MRNLQECQAEIFRRSEQRIQERKKRRTHLLMLCVPLVLCITIFGAYLLPKEEPQPIPDGNQIQMYTENLLAGAGEIYAGGSIAIDGATNEAVAMGAIDSFSFSFTWNTFGVSSYDSTTGKLVKTSDASNPEDYITTYYLTEQEKQKIYDLIASLDITSYPDSYDPQNGTVHTDPSITLILSVKTDTIEKTITAANIADIYKAESPEGQRFLQTCKEIINILTATEEWQALPEYEHFYC